MVLAHILDALKYSYGRGLGFLSEQTGESIHFQFKEHFWKRFQVTESSNTYPHQLLQATVNFSSRNIK